MESNAPWTGTCSAIKLMDTGNARKNQNFCVPEKIGIGGKDWYWWIENQFD